MSTVQPDDLLLLQADTVDETVEWIKNFVTQLAEKKQAAELVSEPILEIEPISAESLAALKPARQTPDANPSVLAHATPAVKG